MDIETNVKRRKFMLGVGLGGVGVAAATVVGGKKVMEAASSPAAPQQGGRGYRATEHVLNYYKSTRL